MIKSDYDNKLKELIAIYESDTECPTESKIQKLQDVISFTREYNSKYKNPYKHHFMGKPILYTNTLVDYLEKLIEELQTNH